MTGDLVQLAGSTIVWSLVGRVVTTLPPVTTVAVLIQDNHKAFGDNLYALVVVTGVVGFVLHHSYPQSPYLWGPRT